MLRALLWYLAGFFSFPVAYFLTVLLLGLVLTLVRAAQDTSVIMSGEWRNYWTHAPGTFWDRLRMQWRAWVKGYEVSAMKVGQPKKFHELV